MSSETNWLLSLIEEDIRSQKPLGADVVTTVKPKSKIQELLKDFYETLRTADSPDAFDQFYEENLKNYTQRSRFDTFLLKLGKKLSLDLEYPYSKEKVEKALFKITERRLEEEDTLHVAYELINDMYSNLVCPPDQIDAEVSAEGLNNQYETHISEEIGKIREKLENGDRREFSDKIQKIRKAEKTEIEKLASELNRIVILGRETWELILYAIMSPYAPPININNMQERPNLHFLFVGDVSTAKSKVNKIVERISPKALRISKSTEASFEGVAKQETIEKGIIDYANFGVLIIPEFTRVFEQFKILREVMDCDRITIVKGGIRKELPVNITFFTGCNPTADFFQNEINLRDQIAFKDGVLSRIDILIPLMATKEKNEHLIDQIDIFGTKQPKLTLEDIHERLKTLSTGMIKLVTNVVLTTEQKQTLKQAFLSHNTKLKHRPLLVLRDLETLCRLTNVIAATNFPHREHSDGGVVKAKDDDIQKAIELWEEIIAQRRTLYTSKRRLIFSLKEKIMMEIARRGNDVRQVELKKDLVAEGLCSERTIERKINQLAREGRIIKRGQRNATLQLAT